MFFSQLHVNNKDTCRNIHCLTSPLKLDILFQKSLREFFFCSSVRALNKIDITVMVSDRYNLRQ